MKWFRVYSEIVDDPKLARMKDETFRVFFYLLAVVSESGEEGNIKMSISDISWRIRINENTVGNAISDLISTGIVLKEEDDSLTVTNWKKRQFESDDSSKRVKRHREKTRNVTETEDETLQKRYCNALDTDTDTDTDTEEKQKQKQNRGEEKRKRDPQNKTPLPNDFQISDRVRQWAERKKRNHLDDHLESFKSKCLANGYKYIDWDEAFMNAVRDDWAKIDQREAKKKQAPGMVRI